ncbi:MULTISPECIES: RrF2 family transcriptional regulator [Roseivirga]|nr:Rrf2 family transcriptional regulator [Roseivirga thermotolerans]
MKIISDKIVLNKNSHYIWAKSKSRMFSKACEYGIRATLYIAQKSLNGQRASLKAITHEIDSPEAFTAKILQQLAKAQVVRSVKGPHGGFEIAREDIDSMRLSEIVNAIDGDNIYKGCGLGLKACNAQKPCPVHHKFTAIRNDLKTMLQETRLLELATSLETGLTFLKR